MVVVCKGRKTPYATSAFTGQAAIQDQRRGGAEGRLRFVALQPMPTGRLHAGALPADEIVHAYLNPLRGLPLALPPRGPGATVTI